ncbi:alpha amylase catalytic region [Cellulomonas flavigena DSM 20109]|uniref:Alpha amylase catalytic region n=1 Tax=Cellulomonas flavigena (strain ATCC 482 / DSM 20109 / BCRC 11376 / JCM 18109 / NBRC 3775 / NCIMB 8073 / NRS 134) TaxID=446466 RepID=D5ULL6_CELFN|nr:alpha-glucosidase [Cellulomonas flavigena]ADG74058.1 alpha amylase catalytic region [Cellulomonas flavigena DSM 20109]
MTFTPDDAPWWTGAVVYQVYPRSFQDSDGDGVGDLRGVLQRVDHLVELGVDVVWFSPIYRSPQDDNGYDISDYQDVDPLFGTLEDLDEVVAALHARSIKVVMDLVVNHTSDEHPWFVESRSSVDSPKRDWYWWRAARPGLEPGTPGAEPTNWASFFSGPTWEYDEASGEYYLHLFSRRQPDLNWENPDVRQAVYAMMRWWLDRGVDGFRMDVINLISKVVGPDGALSDGPVTAGTLGDGSAQYIHGPRLHEYLQEMHREVFDGRRDGLLLVGETPGATVEDGVLFTDPARRELDMVFTFEHVGLDHGPGGKYDPKPLDLRDLKAVMARWQAGLADVGWNALYWDNHDQPRIVSRFGDDGEHRTASATMLATVLHLHRGTPYVYQGEELGMTNAHFTSFDDYRDIEALRYAAQARALGHVSDEQVLAGLAAMSRDNARTPVQWDASPHAGFTTGEPWLPVNPNHRSVNAAAERADRASVFHHYRRLIAMRHADPVVRLGDFRMLLPDHPHVYAFTRSLDGDVLLVLGNFGVEPQEVEVDDAWDGAVVVLGNLAEHAVPAAGRVRLAGWEAVVLRRAAG